MAVVLRIEVRNQLHEVVRSIEEPPGEPFLKFCRVATSKGVRYVDFIWPYQDAMLNPYQLQAWLEDFPRVLDDQAITDTQRDSALKVLAAAREAASFDGYLFIEG